MIRRNYLYVGSRRVHYRRAGSGPPLIVLPAAPHSSAMVEPLLAALADQHTVIALDAPGYGESAALGEGTPAVGDYADALAETLDALRLPRADLYGLGAGAALAVDFAKRWPGRVRRLVLERPPLPTESERAEALSRSWPIMEPDDEGSHLVKAWGRLRDQYTFRPWYRRTIDARIRRDLPAPLDLYREYLDFLRAGVEYWQAPRAAWTYPLAAALAGLGGPVTVVDSAEGFERARSASSQPARAGIGFIELPDPATPDEEARALRQVREALAGDPLPDAPPAPAVDLAPGVVRRTYLDSRAGQLLVRVVGSGRPDGGGRPLVLSYGSLFSGAGSEDTALAWAADRPVIGFDIPGVGDSPPVPGTPEMSDVAAAVADAIRSYGLDEIDLYGSHTSAMLAIELAITLPGTVKHTILDGVTMFTDEELEAKLPQYFQPLRVTLDGGFIPWAWHFVRDMYLWYPWYDHRADHFRSDAALKDAAGQHARTVDFLKGGLWFESPYRAAMVFPSRQRLPLITTPTLFTTAPNDTLRGTFEEAAALVPQAVVRRNPGRATPETREETLTLFRQYLDDRLR